MQKLSLSQKLVIGVVLAAAAAFFAILINHFGNLSALLAPMVVISLFLAYFILRNPELGWYLIIFFLPFERVPAIEVAGVDLKINTILGFATLLAWFLALLGNGKKYKVQPYPVVIPLLLFVMAMILSLSSAGDFSRGLIVMIFVLFTMGLGVLAANMINSKENLRKTLIVLFVSSFIVGVFGLFQFGGDTIGLPRSLTLLKQDYTMKIFGFPRVQAFSMEPLYLANYLMLPIFVALALFFAKIDIFAGLRIASKKSPFSDRSWLMIVLLILLLLVFVLTVSRGGYVGFGAAFLVLILLQFRRIITWRNVIIFILAVGVVGYGVAFALSKGEGRATNEFIGHVLLKDFARGESVQARFKSYQHALTAYNENRSFGIGIGNYGPWFKAYPSSRPVEGWPIVNNEYLEILAETGLAGAISFGLFILVILLRSYSALVHARDPFLKTVLIGMIAAFVGVMVQYNFMSTLYIIHIWILIGLLVGLQTLILQQANQPQKLKFARK